VLRHARQHVDALPNVDHAAAPNQHITPRRMQRQLDEILHHAYYYTTKPCECQRLFFPFFAHPTPPAFRRLINPSANCPILLPQGVEERGQRRPQETDFGYKICAGVLHHARRRKFGAGVSKVLLEYHMCCGQITNRR
jgi:hypothetical protein